MAATSPLTVRTRPTIPPGAPLRNKRRRVILGNINNEPDETAVRALDFGDAPVVHQPLPVLLRQPRPLTVPRFVRTGPADDVTIVGDGCAICFEAMRRCDCVEFNCHHVFHVECVNLMVGNRCPLCRADVAPQQQQRPAAPFDDPFADARGLFPELF